MFNVTNSRKRFSHRTASRWRVRHASAWAAAALLLALLSAAISTLPLSIHWYNV